MSIGSAGSPAVASQRVNMPPVLNIIRILSEYLALKHYNDSKKSFNDMFGFYTDHERHITQTNRRAERTKGKHSTLHFTIAWQ